MQNFDVVQGSDRVRLDEDVYVIKENDGTFVIVPRSIKNKGADARAVANELLQAVNEYDELAAKIRELVEEGRDLGLSWDALGWCMGTSGSAVQKRFGAKSSDED